MVGRKSCADATFTSQSVVASAMNVPTPNWNNSFPIAPSFVGSRIRSEFVLKSVALSSPNRGLVKEYADISTLLRQEYADDFPEPPAFPRPRQCYNRGDNLIHRSGRPFRLKENYRRLGPQSDSNTMRLCEE